MHYGAIKKTDIANGSGVRVSLFVSGCRNHCKGCFQPQTWDFEYGQPFTKDTEDEIIKALCPSWIQGFSILGGEPMEPENQKTLLPFIKRIRQKYSDKDIWLYSGYVYEEIKDFELLQYVDVLVDGPFMEEMKDPSLAFRGSRNQRILNVPESLKAGKAVLEDKWYL
ncbi:MAG: anaerobic ribonucleoside-triphosphate reductase activating protein [Synergistaceae bacterium]|nr:anaerobic ribonucleoside-triphosphate reductase activating protein [Synergistaceae bacterium]MBR0184623.1 anaerobic ribonucleoside-triphosphate reductase activating protein [Synergistaceae bacterium]